jgi:hypothetical protein
MRYQIKNTLFFISLLYKEEEFENAVISVGLTYLDEPNDSRYFPYKNGISVMLNNEGYTRSVFSEEEIASHLGDTYWTRM